MEYSIDGGVSWLAIEEKVLNSGSYDWVVPQIESDSCLIKISDVSDGEPFDVCDGLFSILSADTAGYGLRFDGIDDYVEVEDTEILSGGIGKSISVEAWIRLNNVSGVHPVIMKYLNSTWKDWGMQIADGVLQVGIENSADDWEMKGGEVISGEWTHVAFTFDNSVDLVKLYVNGIEVANKTMSKNMPDTEASVRFGRHGYYTNYFRGLIDEVRIWNYARSSEELKTGMFQRIVKPVAGLLGYWNFDTGTGQIAFDMSGYGNNGRLGRSVYTDVEDPLWEVSDLPLSFDPYIDITSFSGNERLLSGSLYEIIWNSSDLITAVNIEFSSNGGINWDIFEQNLANTGSNFWQVPQILSDNCLIRISDSGDGETADISEQFAIIDREIEKYEIFEVTLYTNNFYSNPYEQVWLETTFIGPSETKTIPGFWDGGNTWKIRFSPDSTGEWSYTTSSNDSDLVSSGNFSCVTSNRKGGIKTALNSGYHFIYENGTPFWWFGETNWAAFRSDPAENLNYETFKNYVDVRASQRFNYIHGNVLAGANEGGEPFTGAMGTRINPGFWQEIDNRIKYMNDNGITSGILLAWKSDKLGLGTGNPVFDFDWTDFPDQESRLAYCKYLAARYGAFNVVWIISGEYDEAPGYQPGTAPEWEQLALEIKNNDPYNRLITIHGTGKVGNFANENWMSFGDYMQIYTNLSNAVLTARNFNKPVINAEYAYFLRDSDGDGVVDKPNSATIEEFRHASWDIVMAGGYFVTGFGSTYLGGRRDPGLFNVNASRNDPAEVELGLIFEFFNSFEWWKFQPLADPFNGSGIKYCLSDFDSNYVVYIRNTASPVHLQLTNTGLNYYTITRYDPRTGVWLVLPGQADDSSLELVNPDNQDWLYFIKKETSSLKLESPNGGEFLFAGDNYKVLWFPGGSSKFVNVDFSSDNGGTWETVAASVLNNGEYDWIVPGIESDSCLMQLSDASDGESVDFSDSAFSIFSSI